MPRIAILLALALVVSAGGKPASGYELDPEGTFATRVVPVTAEAPETIIDTPAGETSIGARPGEVRIVTFWATWCEVCEVEMPLLADVARRYRGRGVALMPVSVDDPPALDLVAAHLEERGLDLPVMHDRDFALAGKVGVVGTPTTIVVDRFGGVVAAFLGQTPWKDPALHDWLNALIDAPDAAASRRHLPVED